MADSILRIKVDSQEYDQKIKRAAEGIQQYAQKCRDAGGTLQYLDDGVLEFVQALGKMDTVATGTKQQLREMSNALTTLTMTYRGLTEEEKASPFGQELAKGIQQLTERAGQAQDAMADVQASIRNAASDTRLFDQMAQGMSVATAGFQGLTGAGKLLGIEMGNDVEVIAKLQAAMAVTNSLTTIQTALQKQSALMQGVNAAKTALATAAQQAYAVATGEATAAQVALNAAMAVNPYAWVVIAIGAAVAQSYAFIEAVNKTIEAGGKLGEVIKNSMINPIYAYMVASDEAEAKQKQWQETLKESENRVNDLAQAFTNLKYAMDLRGATDKELLEAEIDALEKKRTELYGRLGNKGVPHDEWMQISKEIEKVNEEMSKLINKRQTYVNQANQLRKPGAIDTLNTDRELQKALSIAQAEKAQQEYGSWLYNYWDDLIVKINNKVKSHQTEVVKGTTKTTKTQEASKPTKERSIDDIINEHFPDIAQAEGVSKSYGEQITKGILVGMAEKAQTADVTTLKTLMETAIKNGIEGVDIPADELMSKIIGDGADIPDETWQKLQDEINAKLAEMGIEPIKINFETGNLEKVVKDTKTTTKEWQAASTAISAVGNAMNQIEDPAAKVLGTIAQAIATMALSYSQAALATAPSGWGWIAFAATGMATMLSSIAAIKSATETHAGGGFIGGNSLSGDNILMPINGGNGGYAGLSSGELVLNRAQQGVLASALNDNDHDGGNARPYVSGEQIYLGLNNYLKRTGRGELLTARY